MKSRCVYCGSADYGKGCKFGPHNTHFHPGDSKNCAYCGSGSYGKGCKLNPTSDLHIHGINYNTMFKESIQSFFDNNVLLHQLKKDYKEFYCYKLGIIDESGNKIKTPITEQEKLSYTPFTKTILKLKRYLGTKVDLLEAESSLNLSVELNENVEHYEKLLNLQLRIESIVNNLYATIEEAQQQNIPLEDIKKVLKA